MPKTASYCSLFWLTFHQSDQPQLVLSLRVIQVQDGWMDGQKDDGWREWQNDGYLDELIDRQMDLQDGWTEDKQINRFPNAKPSPG